MKGTILDFSTQQSSGVISGSDGNRYQFLASSWKRWKQNQFPAQGMKVDFDIDEEGQAIDIYPDLDARNPLTETVDVGEAIVWFLCCLPIGFMRFGQTGKGWIWVLITIATSGLSFLPAWVDYWMSFSAHQRRQLNDWEFFPK